MGPKKIRTASFSEIKKLVEKSKLIHVKSKEHAKEELLKLFESLKPEIDSEKVKISYKFQNGYGKMDTPIIEKILSKLFEINSRYISEIEFIKRHLKTAGVVREMSISKNMYVAFLKLLRQKNLRFEKKLNQLKTIRVDALNSKSFAFKHLESVYPEFEKLNLEISKLQTVSKDAKGIYNFSKLQLKMLLNEDSKSNYASNRFQLKKISAVKKSVKIDLENYTNAMVMLDKLIEKRNSFLNESDLFKINASLDKYKEEFNNLKPKIINDFVELLSIYNVFISKKSEIKNKYYIDY